MKRKPGIWLGLLFVFLSLRVAPLYLYLDDAYWIAPSLMKDYASHFQTYLTYYGMMRPLVILYYYGIHTLFLNLPDIAHLLPLAVYILAILFTYKIMRLQNVPESMAFSAAVLVASLPFWAESYTWLSASQGIIAAVVVFVQIYLIERCFPDKKALFTVFVLQLVVTFFYETTVLFPFALGFLWTLRMWEHGNWGNRIKTYVRITFYLLLPLFTYVLSNIIVPAKVETRVRFIDPLTSVVHWQEFLGELGKLFSPAGLSNFWLESSLSGWLSILSSPVAMILMTVLLVVVFAFQVSKNDSRQVLTNRVWFWLVAVLVSLVPLTWQQFYLPFRTLALPMSLTIIAFTTLVTALARREKSRQVVVMVMKGASLTSFFILIPIQVSMVTNYMSQYAVDVKLTKEISQKIRVTGRNVHLVYLRNMPANMLEVPIYGDYLYSVFRYFWSGEFFYFYTNHSWIRLSIRSENGVVSQAKELTGKESSLTLLFLGKDQCEGGECFSIVSSELIP